MTTYTPDAPEIAGLEWTPDRTVALAVKQGPMVGLLVDAAQAGSVSAIDLPITTATGAPTIVADVYDTVDLAPGPVVPLTAPPTSDSYVASGWLRDDAVVGNLFTRVDNRILDNADNTNKNAALAADYVYLRKTTPHTLRFQYAPSSWQVRTNGTPYTSNLSERTHAIGLRVIVGNEAGVISNHATMRGIVVLDGQSYEGQSVVVKGGSTHHMYVWYWYLNPATGVPWSLTDVAQFAGGTASIGVTASAAAGGNDLRLYAAQMEWLKVTEKRVATCYGSLSRGGATPTPPATPSATPGSPWWRFPARAPASGNPLTFSKVAGKRYLIAVYQPSGGSASTLPALADSTADPVTGAHCLTGHRSTTVDALPGGNGVPASATLTVGDLPVAAAAGAVAFVQASVISPDSQPYVRLVAAAVEQNRVAQTEIIGLGSGLYANVFALARPAGAVANATTDGLSIELKRASDDASLAGPVSVSGDALGPITDDWIRLAQRFTVGATPGAATKVYVEFSSGTDPEFPWYVAYAQTQDPLYAAATSGGAATGGTINGVYDTGTDGVVSIGTIPAALGGAASAPGALVNQLAGGSCLPAEIAYAALTWAASGLGGKFERYEVERADSDVTDDWVPIARPIVEANAFFNDFEARRNRSVRYRVRVVRTDGSFSDWTTFAAVNCAAARADLVLVCNDNPLFVVGCQDRTPREWGSADADERVDVKIQGKPGIVGFRPTEPRGDRFTKHVFVSLNNPRLSNAGRAVFDTLTTLCHNPFLPYVCLLDGEGRRWYTLTSVRNMTSTEPGALYEADIEFAEATFEPFPTEQQWTGEQNPPITGTTGPPITGPRRALYGADDYGNQYGDPSSTYGA